MSRAYPFDPAKLVIPVLFSRTDLYKKVRAVLERRFGQIDYESPSQNFTFTHYYDEEMGYPIKRLFLSFRNLVRPEHLAGIKQLTNRLELRFREKEKRKVNLDPGLLTLSRFVLATTKENSHRIPLTGGIYGEITLIFRKGEYQPLEWTYPDFRSEAYRETLLHIRSLYKSQIHWNFRSQR